MIQQLELWGEVIEVRVYAERGAHYATVFDGWYIGWGKTPKAAVDSCIAMMVAEKNGLGWEHTALDKK